LNNGCGQLFEMQNRKLIKVCEGGRFKIKIPPPYWRGI